MTRRLIDLSISFVLIVTLSWLFLLIAVAIWLDDGLPIILQQERLGKNRSRFSCLKFRTMYVNNETIFATALASDSRLREEWDMFQKLLTYDPRVTKIGKILRSLSLDELPQLFNVLWGNMSLVGPRPYLPRELNLMGEAADTILSVKPGITGKWQVSGRNSFSFADRLRIESEYVRYQTLNLDIQILFKTPWVILTKRGVGC